MKRARRKRYHAATTRLLACSTIAASLVYVVASFAEAGQMKMPAVMQPTAPPATSVPAKIDHKTHDTPPIQGTTAPSAPSDSGAMEGMSIDSTDMPGMKMGAHGEMMMPGAMGGYSMMRDASGTSWQPDSTPMVGLHGEYAGWATMLHGSVLGVFDHQGGPRGDDKTFSESMLMGMAQRELGVGRLSLRTMLSLDPLMGKDGYPLLLQTGETADGVTPLVDRQHPHDLFMELAGIYSVPLGKDISIYGYVGYPGEPALGPPAFMHRFSGLDDPAAPISHHWLDSTHISYGVITTGLVAGGWKIEGSVFKGREPDQHRWNFDNLDLDSASARLSWNPTPNWALQASYGFIESAEQLETDVNQHRATASASYNLPLDHGNWQTTFAWGRNGLQPGPSLDAFLLESTVSWNRHTVFARAEYAEKNELFQSPSPLAGDVFRVSSFSLGYVYDIPMAKHVDLGLGAVGSVAATPSAAEPAYGSSPASYMAFVRLKIK